MKKLLSKEVRLAAAPISYVFIAAALLSFAPGYPILLSAFFTTLGLFNSYTELRANNDIRYSLLLPVAKTDIVKAKYVFAAGIEGCSFLLMTAVTLIRMLLLRDAGVYLSNALMCANLTFLGFALLIFGLFNLIFLGGFFRTAYFVTKPFVIYGIVTFLVIALAEALHHVPGWEALNAFGMDPLFPQLAVLAGGIFFFAILTFSGCKLSQSRFEKLDI